MELIVDNSDVGVMSTATAYRTIQEAINVANPGDTVTVKAGKYNESVEFPKSGTADSPITLQAQTTGTVTLEGSGRRSPVISIKGKSNIRVVGINTVGGKNGVVIDEDGKGNKSSNILVDRCHILLSTSSGIRASFSENITITDNVVEKTNRGGVHEMISIIGTKVFLVSGNEVFNGSWVEEGKPIEGKEGIDVKNTVEVGNRRVIIA